MKKTIFLFMGLMLMMGINYSQIDIKSKVKDKTNQRIETRTDEGIEKGLDKIEDGVGSIFKKKDKKEKTEETKTTETTETNTTTTETKTKPEDKPKFESYTKYDFVPGDQILYFDDFEQVNIGDYPALWSGNGSGEVRTNNLFPGKWFQMIQPEMVVVIEKDFKLPENFIFEMDFVPLIDEKKADENYDYGAFQMTFYDGTGEFVDDGLYPGNNGLHVALSNSSWQARGYADGAQTTRDGEGSNVLPKINEVNHVIIWFQKSRLRVYFGGKKVIDLPSVIYYPQTKFTRFRISTWGCNGVPMIKNVKFTTASPDTRSKLITEGKLITYGITFDSGKDIVKPESYGTLADIAKVLTENPTVRVKVIGHTDSDGNAPSNLDLSKKRAISVKNSLVNDFKIDASRIETDGKGQTEAISPNTTSEGKAKNRRVEFIKL